jgi:hypothetical protein
MKIDEAYGDSNQINPPIVAAQLATKNVVSIGFESLSVESKVGVIGTNLRQRDYIKGAAIRNLVKVREIKLVEQNNHLTQKKLSRSMVPSPIDTSRNFQYINAKNQQTIEVRDLMKEQLGSAGVAEMSLKTQAFHEYWTGYWALQKEFVAHPRWADRGAMRKAEPYLHEYAANLSNVRPWRSIVKLADMYLSGHENIRRDKVKLLKNLFNELPHLSPEAKAVVKELLIKHRRESEHCYWESFNAESKEVELPRQLEWLAASKLKRAYIVMRDFLKPKK